MNKSNNNKPNDNKSNADWKNKFNDLVHTAQSEIKKTTKIGMKMLSASQSNSEIHENYEQIGMIMKKAIENGEVEFDNDEVLNLIAKINSLEEEMKNIEQDVQNIKKG